MKRNILIVAIGIFIFGMAAPALSNQRHRSHRRHEAPVWSDFSVRLGSPRLLIDITIPGTPYYAPPRVWVPGHWEYVREWVPRRYERVWVPERRGRYDNHRPGYYRERQFEGEYRQKQVWREGSYR